MWIVIIGLAAWFYWWHPAQTLANEFWKNDAAPWERVTAIYFPNNLNMSEHLATENLKNVADCRHIVSLQAQYRNDPDFIKGSYICYVGKEREEGGLSVYRLSLK